MDNAEGSPTPLNFSDEQKSVLTGTLLGDGCLAKKGRFHRLHVKHKRDQRALVEYKHGVFGSFTRMEIHDFDQNLKGKRYPASQFATRTHPLFTEWHKLFYEGTRKRMPGQIEYLLDPLAVAVWFMDDGSADHCGFTIQTHNFFKEEVTAVAGALMEKFFLEVVPRRNKSRWLLYIRSSSVKRFQNLVEPYILSSLRYKLVPRKVL